MSRPKGEQTITLPLKGLRALGMPGRLVSTYCAVLSYDWGQGAGCTASAAQIGNRAGCSRRQAIRNLGALTDQGWLVASQQGQATLRVCRVRWNPETRTLSDERTEEERALTSDTLSLVTPREDKLTVTSDRLSPPQCQTDTSTSDRLSPEVDLVIGHLIDRANNLSGDPKPPRAGARSVDSGPTKGAQDGGTGRKWPSWMPNGEWPKPGPVRPADPPVTGPWRTEGWRERLKALSLSCRRGITPVGLYRLVVEKFGLERTLDAEAYVWQCSVDPDEPPSNCDFVDKLWFDAKDGMCWDEPHLLARLDEEARQFVQSRPARTTAQDPSIRAQAGL